MVHKSGQPLGGHPPEVARRIGFAQRGVVVASIGGVVVLSWLVVVVVVVDLLHTSILMQVDCTGSLW